MPPGIERRWHKKEAPMPYWFEKSIRGIYFITVLSMLCICYSVAHLKVCQLTDKEAQQ